MVPPVKYPGATLAGRVWQVDSHCLTGADVMPGNDCCALSTHAVRETTDTSGVVSCGGDRAAARDVTSAPRQHTREAM
jgi:hypothetical protein